MEAQGLFHWKSSVTLETTSGSREVYLRTLSDVQDEERTDAALAASMIARAELDDKGSKLYKHHISPLHTLDRTGLRDVVQTLQRGLYIRQSRWRVEPIGDPEPPEEVISEDGTKVFGKPTLENVQDWKEDKDSLRGELQKRREEWVAEQVEALEKELEELDAEELLERAIDLHKGSIIERAYNKEWDDHTILYGCYKDGKCRNPFFSEVQEVKDLPKAVWTKIAMAYLELDRFSRNPEALKNS